MVSASPHLPPDFLSHDSATTEMCQKTPPFLIVLWSAICLTNKVTIMRPIRQGFKCVVQGRHPPNLQRPHPEALHQNEDCLLLNLKLRIWSWSTYIKEQSRSIDKFFQHPSVPALLLTESSYIIQIFCLPVPPFVTLSSWILYLAPRSPFPSSCPHIIQGHDHSEIF